MAIETIQSHEGFNSSLNTTPFFLVPPSAIVINVLNACHRIFIQTLTKAAEHFRKTGHRTYAFYWRRDTWGHSTLRDLINQYIVECTSSWPNQELCQQTTRKADQQNVTVITGQSCRPKSITQVVSLWKQWKWVIVVWKDKTSLPHHYHLPYHHHSRQCDQKRLKIRFKSIPAPYDHLVLRLPINLLPLGRYSHTRVVLFALYARSVTSILLDFFTEVIHFQFSHNRFKQDL
jgi:hypothetical protein